MAAPAPRRWAAMAPPSDPLTALPDELLLQVLGHLSLAER